jgi:transposase
MYTFFFIHIFVKHDFKKNKKMEKNLYRGYILTRYKLGLSSIDIFKELELAYLDRAPSYMTVCRWVNRFKDGSESLEDEERIGRPITAVTTANIDIVRALIEENPHISYSQIEAETMLYPTSIHEIIHGHLFLKKITSRWCPYNLTDDQKKKRVACCIENLAKFNEGKWRLCDIMTGDESWFYFRTIGHKQTNCSWVAKGQCPKTFVRRSQYEPKSMFTIFFKSTGVIGLTVLIKARLCVPNIISKIA